MNLQRARLGSARLITKSALIYNTQTLRYNTITQKENRKVTEEISVSNDPVPK